MNYFSLFWVFNLKKFIIFIFAPGFCPLNIVEIYDCNCVLQQFIHNDVDYFTVRRYQKLYTHFPVNRHLGNFQFERCYEHNTSSGERTHLLEYLLLRKTAGSWVHTGSGVGEATKRFANVIIDIYSCG